MHFRGDQWCLQALVVMLLLESVEQSWNLRPSQKDQPFITMVQMLCLSYLAWNRMQIVAALTGSVQFAIEWWQRLLAMSVHPNRVSPPGQVEEVSIWLLELQVWVLMLTKFNLPLTYWLISIISSLVIRIRHHIHRLTLSPRFSSVSFTPLAWQAMLSM